MPIPEIIFLSSSIASIIFGTYQWWTKRKVVRLESTKLTAEVHASQAIEASNLMDVVNLLLKSMGTIRDELIVEIKKVSGQLDIHALQDTVVQAQMNTELGRINETMCSLKKEKNAEGSNNV